MVNRNNAGRMTRQTGNLDIPRVNTAKYDQHYLHYLAPKIWNDLLKNIQLRTSLTNFKSSLVSWSGLNVDVKCVLYIKF